MFWLSVYRQQDSRLYLEFLGLLVRKFWSGHNPNQHKKTKISLYQIYWVRIIKETQDLFNLEPGNPVSPSIVGQLFISFFILFLFSFLHSPSFPFLPHTNISDSLLCSCCQNHFQIGILLIFSTLYQDRSSIPTPHVQ